MWAFIGLFLSIIQIGLLPVSIPAAIYVFFVADPLIAILFAIWMVFISTVDNILKPILMGKDAVVPIPILFLGSIGGFIAAGIIGLFFGAIVLAIGYTLYLAWLADTDADSATAEVVVEPDNG